MFLFCMVMFKHAYFQSNGTIDGIISPPMGDDAPLTAEDTEVQVASWCCAVTLCSSVLPQQTHLLFLDIHPDAPHLTAVE